MVVIRAIETRDAADWKRMRQALWPARFGEHAADVSAYFPREVHDPAAVLVALIDNQAVGFVEVSMRSHAEGCYSGSIAYLEGWYVQPEHRLRGIGKELLEIASDSEIGNEAAISAHKAIGFQEVGRSVCFRKSL